MPEESVASDCKFKFKGVFSQRGHISLFHTPSARDVYARRYNIMRLNGTDAELDITLEGLQNTVNPSNVQEKKDKYK